MAIVTGTNEDFPISKRQAKISALKNVLRWATLNWKDTEEDYYEFFSVAEGSDEIVDDQRTLDLTPQEREWMRKEFETIGKILLRRLEKHRA